MMLITGGKVYTKNGFRMLDILVKDGKIEKLATKIKAPEASSVFDAKGKTILPGAIDVHTHFDLDVGFAKANDDYYTGTVAAACGGTTTIVDHPGFGPEGCGLNHQIALYHTLAQDKAVIDYSFHGVMQRMGDDMLDDLEKLKAQGITSIKVYMTYAGRLSDEEILRVLKKTKEQGMLVTVHCENNDVVEQLKAEFVRQGKTGPEYHPKSRPPLAEAEAINRVLTLGRMAGDAPLYLVHVSAGISLEYIDFFRRRGYQNFFVESCPQYLFLDDALYKKPDGLKYILSPPLRAKENQKLLMQALKLGEINTLGTDHCPFNYAQDKQMGKDDFTKCPNGMPGVETRYPLLISQALEGKISFDTVIKTCAENPAKLFGLYPKKGHIAVGADADLIVLDEKGKGKITQKNLHENCDYTPFEGIKTRGRIEAVFSRGEKIVENNDFVGEKGRGKFISRKTYQPL
ncbi:MAG: dihydropyrimidinase [Eubacteriales bacterium]